MIGESARYSLDQDGFMMAFAARGLSYSEAGYISDTKFVRWYATFITQENDVYREHSIPLHRCSEADLQKFYPPKDERTGGVVT